MYPPDGWHHFSPFGGLHLLMVIVCAAFVAAPALLGRRLGPEAEAVLRRALAALAVGYWLAYNVWWTLHHGLDLREGLPLHLCDINALIAPYALLTGRRWARATLYFWTAALTAQAFIQPALTAGPASLTFWAFWAAHTIIAACALYDIVVLGFRPDWGDFLRAVAASFAYVALVVPINAWLGADYGYLGNPAPDISVPPLVLAFGPWPQRAIILAALVPPAFVAVLLPWLLVRQNGSRRDATRRSSP